MVPEAELEVLRGEQEEMRRKRALEEEEKAKRKRSSSSSKGKKKKKKKKRKEEKEAGGAAGTPAPSLKLGGKTVARKSLASLYEGTGMDPSASRRRRPARRVKKSLKRGKESSGSSSSSSGSSGSSVGETESLLEDKSRILRISQLAPGLLSSLTLQQTKPYVAQLMTSGWEQDEKSLPPIMGVYNRSFLHPRLSGGVAREATTLCFAADLLIQGSPSEALDTLIQRVKSIEAASHGTPWMTAQRMELVPPPDPQLSSRAEYQSARKESKLEAEAHGRTSSQEKGKGKSKEKGGGKGKTSRSRRARKAMQKSEEIGRKAPGRTAWR